MAQAQAPRRVVPFDYATTRFYLKLADQTFQNQGDTKSVIMQRVGFGAYLLVSITGAITSGAAASAGTFSAADWPYNLLSRIVCTSNSGFQFVNFPGRMMPEIFKMHHIHFDPGVPISPTTAGSGTGGARNAIQVPGLTGTGAAGTAIANATVYPIRVNYLIPFVSDTDCKIGLVPLQSNNNSVQLDLTLGTAVDWLGAGGSLGTAPTISLTVKTRQMSLAVPSDPMSRPDLGFTHRLVSEQQTWATSGEQIYRIPVNGVIMRAFSYFRNAGVPAAFFATPGDPRTNNFTQVRVNYAGTQQPESYDFEHMIFDHRMNYGTDVRDGVLPFDFALGSGGSPEAGVNPRDYYNTRRLTEFLIGVTTSIAPGANSTMEVLRQELQMRKPDELQAAYSGYVPQRA